MKELTSKASGSVILGLSKSDIEELPVTIPDNQTLDRFHEICSVLFDKIANQSQNSRTLASIRDCLLPKLMSGKIRVPVQKENVEVHMMSKIITESEVEDVCLGMLRDLGYGVVYGPDISEGGRC